MIPTGGPARPSPTPLSPDCQRMAELCFQVRRYCDLHQHLAEKAGVHPKQFQLIQTIGGMPNGIPPTIQNVAARLMIRHNSCVELVDRATDAGLLQRTPDAIDRRRVLLRLTPRAQELLAAVLEQQRRELEVLGPKLQRALEAAMPRPEPLRTQEAVAS